MIIFLVQQEDENKEDIKSWSSFDWNEIVRREIKKNGGYGKVCQNWWEMV